MRSEGHKDEAVDVETAEFVGRDTQRKEISILFVRFLDFNLRELLKLLKKRFCLR